MKVQVTLTEWEIKNAIGRAIREKLGDHKFYDQDIGITGSVKYKKKSVRKQVLRIVATAEIHK